MSEALQQALNSLVALGAERALVVQGPAPYSTALCHGFQSQTNWMDQVSLGVLERSMQGEPLFVADVRQSPLVERWSVEVSGISAIICVPFWSPSSRVLGLLYIDTTCLSQFSRDTLSAVQNCARALERALYGGNAAQPAPTHKTLPKPKSSLPEVQGIRLGLSQRRPSAPPASPFPEKTRKAPAWRFQAARPNSRSLAVFYRALTTMMSAGLPIQRALLSLAQHQDQPQLQMATESLSKYVAQGLSLSAAMGKVPQVFSTFDRLMVEVGETTGALDKVLAEIAHFREKSSDHSLRLQSTLTYPLFLCAFCGLALLLGPPLVLRSQLEVLRTSGQALPWLTQALIGYSDLLHSPWGWASLAVGAFCLSAVGMHSSTRARLILWVSRLLFRQASLRRLRESFCSAHFCRTLGLTYKVGIPVDRCLSLAFGLTPWPADQVSLEVSLTALREGESLAGSLQRGGIPSTVVSLVRVGEETGRVDQMMSWIANFFEFELENNLSALLSLLQPLLMGVLGSAIGLILIASLMPMVGLVQSL